MNDLTKCPRCGGEANNGFDRCDPPNPYLCHNCVLQNDIEFESELKAKLCKWQQDDDGVWETGCDNMFELTTGTPGENKMQFCPYCGRKIKESR